MTTVQSTTHADRADPRTCPCETGDPTTLYADPPAPPAAPAAAPAACPAPAPAARAPAAAPPPPLSADELREIGDRVLAGGSDADKQRRLASELARLHPDNAARLMASLVDRVNLDAMPSAWLSAASLGQAMEAGTLTRAQAGTIAEAFARAYDNGICRSPNGCWMDPSAAIGQDEARNFLDTGHVTYLDDIADVNRFLNSGSPSALDGFLRDYARAELQAMSNPRYATAGTVPNIDTVMHLLAGAGTPQLVVEVFGCMSVEQRQGLYGLMQHSIFGADATTPEGAKVIAGWAASDDPLAILLQAVGAGRGLGEAIRVPGVPFAVGREARATPADRLALELVQWAGSNTGAFWTHDGTRPIADRASAMAGLFTAHTRFLMDALTAPTTGTDNESGKALPANLDNIEALANVLRLTMLNDSLPAWQRTQIQRELFAYADAMTASYDPNARGQFNPMERVGLLLSAMQLGVSQSWRSAEDQRAAREQVVGFFTDLLIDQAADVATGKLTPAGKLAEIVGGEVIDAATEAGKARLRTLITDFLFGPVNNSGLRSLQDRINALTDAYVEQLPAAMQTPVIVAIDRVREASNTAR
jgi:hypothetical protein